MPFDLPVFFESDELLGALPRKTYSEYYAELPDGWACEPPPGCSQIYVVSALNTVTRHDIER